MRGLNPKLWMAALAVLVFPGFSAVAAPAPVYENRVNEDTPVIDTTTFLNRGLIEGNAFDEP